MAKALTDALIRSAKASGDKRLEIADSRCVGLVVRITPAGVKSFSFRFRDPRSGNVSRATIGAYPDVSLADARKKADQYRAQVAGGLNPVEAKRKARLESTTRTFQALADRYIEEHAKRFKKSHEADERNLRLHVTPKWGKRRFDEISRADVIELVEGMISAGTPTQANRVQALISKVFSFAEDVGLLPAHPFARLSKRAPENVGRRVLSDAEIRVCWPRIVLPPVTRKVGLAIRLQLLTAARPGEVAGLQRSELHRLTDPENAAWVLPAERSKNGRAHYVPLSPLAVETIHEALKLIEDDEQYLFPSPTREREAITAHSLAVAMARFARKLDANLPGAKEWKADPPSPHDLRRTVATRLSETGFPKEDRDAVLNHTPQDVGSKHYDLYDRAKEKRKALNTWSAAVQMILENKGGGAVVPLLRTTGTQ